MTEPRVTSGDGRSAMGRAGNALPFRPYVYKGVPDPPEVIAARKRAREVALQRQRERKEALAGFERVQAGRNGADCADEVMPDAAPGFEWYRELADGDELAETTGIRDRYQDAMAAVPEPDPLPAPPVTAASRCGCGYLTTARGHKVMCGA